MILAMMKISSIVLEIVQDKVSFQEPKNYVENTVFRMTDETFKSHFRMRRETFEFLINLLGPDLQKQSVHFGRHPISVEKQLLLSIWTMATPDSYRSVCDRFDVGKATAWRTVWKVVKSIYNYLPVYIKWPTREEARITSNHIYRKYGFPNVLGAIDGTHIRIAQPKEHHASYINRKGFHSIQTQLVCDHKLKIIHAYCGQAGSVHDARVFRLSNLQNCCTPEFFPDDTHLLGDKAYSIQPCIMVPYRNNGNFNQDSLRYNTIHSSARMMIERANALLKGRFRSLLDKLPFKRTDLIPYYVIACCILHNICIMRDDLIDIPILVNHEVPVMDVDIEMNNDMKVAGMEKRERLKNFINNNV
ncbi:putative nuclease HARBI1 isoform X1 [Cotesia glomerata]|uniref:putative nuclease HARBI1 isoform X1 n=2 Tax=Cotesia glomerata TaxID=32391 RepID=UPI001D01F262|nr:putative nuclease HARBI1 isoform X1 [Cotesia glomerata]